MLKKTITTFQLMMTTLCGMIGIGWMFGAYSGAIMAGPAAIFSWIFAGIAVSLIALLYTEITIAIPVTGSYMRYPHITHGHLSSFMINWMPWLSCVMVAPTEVCATIQYLQRFFPSVMIDNTLTNTGLFWAIVLMSIFTYINMIGIQVLLRYSTYMTYWKIAVPIVTLIILSYYGIQENNVFEQELLPYGWSGVFEFSSGMCFFSLLGFLEATTLAGELKNPERAIPIAVIGSIIICTILYIMMQWLFLSSIPISVLAQGWQSITLNGEGGPFATIATHLGLGYLVALLYLDAVITPTGTAMVYTASTSRMVLAMSENKNLPKILLKLNDHSMPLYALIFNTIIGIVLLLCLDNINQLIKFQSITMMMAYAFGPCSFLALRKRLPKLKRTFYLPCATFFAWIVFFLCAVMIYCSGLIVNIVLTFIIIISFFSYICIHAVENKELKNNIWFITHVFFLLFISYVGNYEEGLKLIPFGFDFFVIALESWIVLQWSVFSSQDTQSIENEIQNSLS